METEIERVTEHHHGSHKHLVDVFGEKGSGPAASRAPDPGPAGSSAVDAIVVPTIRHPSWLDHAIRLARDLSCPLVTLHSRPKWSKPKLAAARMRGQVEFLAVDIGGVDRLNLPDFKTTALLRGSPFARTTDLSAKRNTGLLLARLMGWQRVVFLDDDIEVGGHEEVARAAALLDTYDAVGMHIGGYPDNSVVCHAHRLTGGHQESFLGGGALAVETTRCRSFFPNIYNEDWFYLLGETSLRRLAVTGQVRQRPYDPFDRPVRARDQELGDVLAEGVYWLLDGEEGTGWKAARHPAYWTGFLAKRKAFVADVLRRVRELPPGAGGNRQAMEQSLLAALGRLSRIEPEFCVAYLKAWLDDRHRWDFHLTGTPQFGGESGDAMKWLADVMKWLVRSGAPLLDTWSSRDDPS